MAREINYRELNMNGDLLVKVTELISKIDILSGIALDVKRRGCAHQFGYKCIDQVCSHGDERFYPCMRSTDQSFPLGLYEGKWMSHGFCKFCGIKMMASGEYGEPSELHKPILTIGWQELPPEWSMAISDIGYGRFQQCKVISSPNKGTDNMNEWINVKNEWPIAAVDCEAIVEFGPNSYGYRRNVRHITVLETSKWFDRSLEKLNVLLWRQLPEEATPLTSTQEEDNPAKQEGSELLNSD